ncbi:viral intermediate transcription factor VITF-3 [Cotia virus SPAn232]|uniref:Intermediate transcription factor 3 small subunit n=2 Tax=Cotia virus TaxID=39444 RepID=H6TA87_9POXV|nr:viral intermediate transcription factor VITF-3 [Cotia virus SPAn232]ADT91127.1 viral intermediate transcription factor VITF-3 [Cotia virus SPAn232]AIT70731.1 viral intermediate transcription factor VITF-3 [Cotia virus]
MFDPVPDLNIEANIELGDVSVDLTKTRVGETASYYSKNRRLIVHKTKDDERKLALRLFLPRMYILSYKEVNYLFRCIDSIKDVAITKKNNVIVAPYIIILTMASKGYKLTDSILELFFPEIYNENSKKFKFSSQVCIIKEKLGYSGSQYHTYDFELYYSTIALAIRNNINDDSESNIFDTRIESEFIRSFSEITYRFYILLLKSNLIQWSSSTGTIINQMVNIVLDTIYNILEKDDITNINCKLAIDTTIPFDLIKDRYDKFKKLMNDIQSTNSFKISKSFSEILHKYFIYY